MNERKISILPVLLIIILVIPLISTCNSNLTIALDEKMEYADPSPPGFINEAGRTIIFDDIRATAVDLSWIKANDDLAEPNELEYCILYSSSDNIDTPVTALENGTIGLDWTADISSGGVSGLTILTTYYFNILVRDKADNRSAYSAANAKTKNDTELPIPGNNGDLTISSVNMEDVTVSWSKGSDDISPTETLQYLVYYTTTQPVSGDDVVSTGTAFGDWSSDIDSIQVTSLLDNVKYYVSIAVKDEVGNTESYGFAEGTTVKHPRIFWADNTADTIKRADHSGLNPETIISSGTDPNALAIDPDNRKAYWIDTSDNTIKRANFDDGLTSPETVILSNLSAPSSIAVDHTNNYLFWTDSTLNNIYRSALPPLTNDADDWIFLNNADNSVSIPMAIDIDMAHQLIYWSEWGAGARRIRQSDFSGTTIVTVANLGNFDQPIDLCVRPGSAIAENIIYFADMYNDTITSLTMSESLVDLIDTELSNPWEITIDIESDTIFWTDNLTQKIYSYYLNQSSPTKAGDDYDIMGSLASPRGIDVY
jgi:hypothetical protein